MYELMDVWMDLRMDGWMNEWMNEWMDEYDGALGHLDEYQMDGVRLIGRVRSARPRAQLMSIHWF